MAFAMPPWRIPSAHARSWVCRLMTGAPLSPIPEEVQRVTIERNRFNNSEKGYRPIGKREWPALLRKLDKESPGYRD